MGTGSVQGFIVLNRVASVSLSKMRFKETWR